MIKKCAFCERIRLKSRMRIVTRSVFMYGETITKSWYVCNRKCSWGFNNWEQPDNGN